MQPPGCLRVGVGSDGPARSFRFQNGWETHDHRGGMTQNVMSYKNQEKATACDDLVSCRPGRRSWRSIGEVGKRNRSSVISVEQKVVRARTEMAPFRAGGRAGSFETLREREQRFHELLEALPAAIYTTDANGKITYFN